MEFAGTCRGLPVAYRQYLIFLLTDVPLGVTQSRLTDLAMIMRPFGRIIATVASGCRNFHAYEGNGFCALALDMARTNGDSERTRADIVHVGAIGRGTQFGAMIMNVEDPNSLHGDGRGLSSAAWVDRLAASRAAQAHDASSLQHDRAPNGHGGRRGMVLGPGATLSWGRSERCAARRGIGRVEHLQALQFGHGSDPDRIVENQRAGIRSVKRGPVRKAGTVGISRTREVHPVARHRVREPAVGGAPCPWRLIE